jgi:hypothetical protein
MNTIVTSNKSTDFTNTEEQVLVEMKNNKKYVYRKKYRTKFFQKKEQLDYVIHDLVVNKGFVMDKINQEFAVFTHGKLDSKYTLYFKELYGEYEDKELLAELD